MNKKILYLLLSLTIVSFIGCTNKVAPSTGSNSSTSSTASPQGTNAVTNETTPFTLTDSSSYFCPFVFKDKILLFPNPADNNRFSDIPELSLKNMIETKDVIEAAKYSTDNIALIDQKVYLTDSSDNNALISFDFTDKTYSKNNTHSINNLIAANTDLFYLNKDDGNKIYKYDTTLSNSMLVCPDNVGSFIVSGDFIIYQNLSDNGKLYSLKIDGTNRQKLVDPTCPTDFTATSFVVFDGQLLFFDSSDNNNLYIFDPSSSKYTRLCIMNGSQLKIINKLLYFINGDDSNNLYSLSVDLKTLTATYKPEISEGINEYYLTSEGIFYSPSINVNNIYFKKFSTQS